MSTSQIPTYSEILKETAKPAVAINSVGIFIHINKAFEATYGWQATSLLGMPVTTIMPSYMRDAHNIGFSRFLVTEVERLIGKPIDVPVCTALNKVIHSKLLIISNKLDDEWQFAALIYPKTEPE